jgi:hypothetical protein
MSTESFTKSYEYLIANGYLDTEICHVVKPRSGGRSKVNIRKHGGTKETAKDKYKKELKAIITRLYCARNQVMPAPNMDTKKSQNTPQAWEHKNVKIGSPPQGPKIEPNLGNMPQEILAMIGNFLEGFDMCEIHSAK